MVEKQKQRVKNLFVAGLMLLSVTLITLVKVEAAWGLTFDEATTVCDGLYSLSQTTSGSTIQCFMDRPAQQECEAKGGSYGGLTQFHGSYVCVIPFTGEAGTPGGGGGGGSSTQNNATGDPNDYSRPSHPGRERTENDNNDPGGSEVKDNSGIPAVPGKGYSSTGGLKTEPEKLETVVLDCDGDDKIFCILNTGLTVLTWGVGIAATVGIVFSGIQYASSRGNAEQMAKTIKRIIGIVIGLLLYAMLWGILNWLIPGGVI